MQKFVLEKSKYFPYVAWATVVGFSVFVFTLVMNLQDAAEDLRVSTENLEAAVQNLPTAIDNDTEPKTRN